MIVIRALLFDVQKKARVIKPLWSNAVDLKEKYLVDICYQVAFLDFIEEENTKKGSRLGGALKKWGQLGLYGVSKALSGRQAEEHLRFEDFVAFY